MSHPDIKECEALIRRLKTLSLAQTIFLKVNRQFKPAVLDSTLDPPFLAQMTHQSLLFGKLNQAKTIVSKTLLLMDNSQSRDIIELRDALKSLNINDIEVDVTSTRLMMNEELAILRNSTHDPKLLSQPAKISGTTGKDSAEEKLIKFQEENSQLRELLEQSKKELQKAQVETTRTTSAVGSVNQNFANEIDGLKSDVSQKKLVLLEQGNTILRLEKEVAHLNNTVQIVKKEKEAEETVRTGNPKFGCLSVYLYLSFRYAVCQFFCLSS